MKHIDAIGWYKKIHFREVVCLFFIERLLLGWGVTISLHFVDLEFKISSASNMEEWHYF